MPATRADLIKLADPFAPDDIEWRIQTSGETNGKKWARVLAYVTNRAIMDRFDAVVGPENWKNAYQAGPSGGIVCLLAVRVESRDADTPNGEWVTKVDGAENTDIESVKGGLSNAMKRAAVQWGLGRYLYHLEEGWAVISETGRFSAKTKDGKWFKWDPPALPAWAMPGGSGKPDGVVHRSAPASGTTVPTDDSPARGRTSPSASAPSSPPSPSGAASRTPAPNAPRGTHHGSPGVDADGVPLCPTCSGRMWDNRENKRNPKAPDFKCRDKGCEGVIWPAKAPASVTVPMAASGDAEWAPVDDGAPF